MKQDQDGKPKGLDGKAEHAIELTIYRSRWLLAPFYLGLVVMLVLLLIVFARELAHEVWAIVSGVRADGAKVKESEVILLALSLIDMSLAANLLLTVIFAGYENFVSQIDAAKNDEDRPVWMGTVDFSGLKLKLIASIVAISGIHLLKSFMNIGQKPLEERNLMWLVIIHMTFVASGVLLAFMDRLSGGESSTPAQKN
jgi:uncharacterized protein (TIGR00645 family)